jgi:hypothetical protein
MLMTKDSCARRSRKAAKLLVPGMLKAAAASLVVAALFSSGVAIGTETKASRPVVDASVEALLLWRSGLPDRPLYFNSSDPSIVPLDAGEVPTSMAAGPRFRINLNSSDEASWEFNYFNVQSFAGSRVAESPAGDLEQDYIFGFLYPDVTVAQAVSTSAIQSFELNRRKALLHFDGEFLYGFRWVEWNDRLTITDTTVTGTLTGSDLFIANTYDSLYGGQIGLDMLLFGDRDTAWIEGIGKAGVFYNQASQSSYVDSLSTNQIERGTSAAADLTSFFGELGFTGCYRVNETWAARLGFTMFWLGNGTAAADQLYVNNLYSTQITSGISNGAGVFLYGINLGLQAAW